ncbi:CHASE domain-containing protein [Lysobacter sp. A3-1-A15]|uniref:CHASE domain-containing protein n=1 Tax=Novilysobacter viscosus TaxID=3098602 RepID=UPI002ED9EB77
MPAPANTPDSNAPGTASPSRRGHLLALAVLIGSLLIVFVTWRAAYEREVATAQARFVARTDEVVYLLRERMSNFELVLQGGSALFATVARPSPQQWRAYASGLDSEERLPALVGLGFAPYVSNSSLSLLQVEWRGSGFGLLEVRPRGQRSHYAPILLLEPRSPENLSAMGFDMYSEPVRHAAMEAAMETGESRLTAPVHLVQDGSDSATGLLLYKPVYRAGDRPATRAARLESMQGWVYMPFRMEGFVDMALGDLFENQRFRIYDTTDGRDQLLYTTQLGQAEEPPAFRHSADVEHFGRRWRVEFDSPPLAQAVPRLSGPSGLQSLLALGLFTSLLMYAIAWVLARTQARAQSLATRMTEDFRRSEQRFRSALQYSAIGKALLDSEGRIVEANPALGEIVGSEPGALIGLNLEALFEDKEPLPIGHGSGTGQGPLRATRRLHHHGGGMPRHAQLTYAPVPGNVGQDVTGLMQVEDITERLRAEARVHALNRTLEARVALRTRELSQANQELESFAYSVSHDLRAPLRAIDGFSRVLVERYGDRLDDGGRDYLARVRKAASRMGDLIDALLKITRVTRGELKLERIDLSRMALEVVEELRAGSPDHAPVIEVAPGLEAVADAALVRNLLGNLLGNAWKFTRGSEGPLIVFGSAMREDGEREFYVRDNGAGFSQEYVDKLFRPFQRLHAQEEFAGHGIGLASVKRIVERHGGSIRAEGVEGKGATFWFTLPGEDDQAPEPGY